MEQQFGEGSWLSHAVSQAISDSLKVCEFVYVWAIYTVGLFSSTLGGLGILALFSPQVVKYQRHLGAFEQTPM